MVLWECAGNAVKLAGDGGCKVGRVSFFVGLYFYLGAFQEFYILFIGMIRERKAVDFLLRD